MFRINSHKRKNWYPIYSDFSDILKVLKDFQNTQGRTHK